MSTTHRLDGPALYVLLDFKRQQLGITWRELQRRTGCQSTRMFTHLRQDEGSLHGDTLLSLLAWLDLPGVHRSITTENEAYE